MITLTATQFVNNFGQRNQEVQVEPIEVKSHGRTVGYYVSPQEYALFEQLKAKMRRSYRVENLPDEFWNSFDQRRAESPAVKDTESDGYNILFQGDPGYPA